jgi:nicotinate-nucleotide adenylyltransferase
VPGLSYANQVLRRRAGRVKKIGIFAGTFDPVHNGHLAFAEAALKQGLDKVMFLVEPRPRRKQGVRALEHRIAMVQAAIKDHPKLGTIVLEQARFTPHETLPALQARFKGYRLVLLFGDDVIAHIAHWPHVEELVSSVELMIASRHGKAQQLHENMETLHKVRHLKFTYGFVDPRCPEISSSKLRAMLRRRQQPQDIPDVVYRYIKSHRLYAPNAITPK